MKNKQLFAGFTLVELLTAIAVIGIISTIGLNSYIGIQRKARDATRKSHLQQIRVALELYRSDVGSYPPASEVACGTQMNNGTNIYMQVVPCDPQGLNGGNYSYTGGYTLTSCLENIQDPQGISGSTPGCTTGRIYRVTNP